jgi:hypothetical protein
MSERVQNAKWVTVRAMSAMRPNSDMPNARRPLREWEKRATHTGFRYEAWWLQASRPKVDS